MGTQRRTSQQLSTAQDFSGLGADTWLLRPTWAQAGCCGSGSRKRDKGAMLHSGLVTCLPPKGTSASIPPLLSPYLSDLMKKKHFPRAQWGLYSLEHTHLKHL